jgi:rare lipoprotein A
MNKNTPSFLLYVLFLTACGTTTKHKIAAPSKPAAQITDSAYLNSDGPEADTPANLDATPDAVLSNEPLHRYANRPYTALGKSYTPLTQAGEYKEHGIASWYGKKFHGQPTSSGEKYDMYGMTAAHPTLPIPSYARVTNLANQKSVVVRINDRGPFLHDRVIDLSYTAAHKLGIVNNGSAEVEVESLSPGASITPTSMTEPVQSVALKSVISPVAEVAPAEKSFSLEASDNNVYLQLGAFKTQEAAETYLVKMRNELIDTGKEFKLTSKDGLVRVHIGPYVNQAEARIHAEILVSKLGFKPLVNLP